MQSRSDFPESTALSFLIAILLVFCVLTPGCTTPLSLQPPNRLSELKAPVWHLVSYNGDSRTMVPVSPQTNITLKFGENGELGGFIDGCRRYSGHYTQMGETISISNITQVYENGCALSDKEMEMKNTYFSLLQKSPRFNIDDNILILGYFDAQKYLVFSRI